MKADNQGSNRKSIGSQQQMFSKQNKSNKNSVISLQSNCTPGSVAKSSLKLQNMEDSKSDHVITEEVNDIQTQDRDDPIIKSGTASARIQHEESLNVEEQYSNVNIKFTNAAASPNSPPSRQSKVQNTHRPNSSINATTISQKQFSRNSKFQLQDVHPFQKLVKQNSSSKQPAINSARYNAKVGSFAQHQKNPASLTRKAVGGKESSTTKNHHNSIPSTLDPANPLAHTSVSKAKKQPLKERTTSTMLKSQSVNFSQAILHSSTTSRNHITQAKNTPMALASSSQKNFKMYNTVQLSASSSKIGNNQNGSSHSTGGFFASPRNSLQLRRGAGNSPLSSHQSMTKDQQESAILHSQAMIQRSKNQRLNSGGRTIETDLSDVSASKDAMGLPIGATILGQSSPLHSSQANLTSFGDTMRDEMVVQLRSQLEDERKKHRDMKQMFDDTMQNMELQNRDYGKEGRLTQTASEAVDEIFNKGALSQAAMADELAKQKNLVTEMKQNETDLQNQNQNLEKQFLHAQMRVKEAAAKEQIMTLQQETNERRLRMEIEKLRGQVKDLRSNEEQIKSDHAQRVIELNDQIESERQKQATESEENYLIQINEIKQAHARERETLVQQKFNATQELQMIKMDHSELIRNTNFEERQELMQTISELQAQVSNFQIVLTEQQSQFDLQLNQSENEKKVLDTKNNQLTNYLETEKAQKKQIEEDFSRKCNELEAKLDKVTMEKDKLYKNQMNKIQENLETLKEQIASTNQSLIDQSYVVSQPDQSALTSGVIARLHSPDFYASRHRRGDPLGAASPRVPRRYAHLNIDSQKSVHQRLQSPLAALQSHRQREKSGDQRALLSGSEMQELTQMISGGAAEQTINLGPLTAGQALFNQTALNNNNPNVVAGHNSFLMEPLFNDYYVEYVMLYKLQALTNNFTCQKCWQVLNFQRFFDDNHECLKKIEVQQIGEVRHSKIGTESIEEFKETRAMFSGGNMTTSPTSNYEMQSVNLNPIVADNQLQKQDSISHGQPFVASTRQRRDSYQNIGSMMKATAHAAASGTSVIVTEINLANSKGSGLPESDIQSRPTGSFKQLHNNNLENSLDRSRLATDSQNGQRRPKNVSTSRQQVNSMQLDIYLQKIKEYRVKIEELEELLRQCRQENDCLIDDLRDTKTKVAVLEESKAQLQMEVTKLKKVQKKKNNNQTEQIGERKQINTTPSHKLNQTVNAQTQGGFGFGGKSNISVRIQPALTQSAHYVNENEQSRFAWTKLVTAPETGPDMNDSMQQNLAQSRNKIDQSDELLSQKRQQIGANEKAVFRSPQGRMVPLSQKFSAFPTSELKSRGGTSRTNNALSTIYGGHTRNYGNELSMQSSHTALQSCSFNNLTQQLNGSMQHLRHVGGALTERVTEIEQEYEESRTQSRLMQVKQRDLRRADHHRKQSNGGESCELSPENDSNTRRHQAQDGRSYLAEMDNQNVEGTDGNVSSLNPLVTTGLLDVTQNSSNQFERTPQGITPHSKGKQQASGILNMTNGKRRMTKLNNPYDEVSITQQRMIEDSSDYSQRDDTSPIHSNLNRSSAETRQTIFPGLQQPRNRQSAMQNKLQEPVQVKKAVPIPKLALNQSPRQQIQTTLSNTNSPSKRFQTNMSKRSHNPHEDIDKPLGLDDLEK